MVSRLVSPTSLGFLGLLFHRVASPKLGGRWRPGMTWRSFSDIYGICMVCTPTCWPVAVAHEICMFSTIACTWCMFDILYLNSMWLRVRHPRILQTIVFSWSMWCRLIKPSLEILWIFPFDHGMICVNSRVAAQSQAKRPIQCRPHIAGLDITQWIMADGLVVSKFVLSCSPHTGIVYIRWRLYPQ